MDFITDKPSASRTPDEKDPLWEAFEFVPAKPTPFLTESQRRALDLLSKMARLRGIQCNAGGLTPRLRPLIVGPSGSGKTTLLRILAEREKLALISISVGGWAPIGSHSKPNTIIMIRDAVRRAPEGVIYLDELDKLNEDMARNSAWYMAVWIEILMSIDSSQNLLSHGWTQADVERVQTGYFIVGGGAWQRVADSQRETKMGFGQAADTVDYAAAVLANADIPAELLLRFNTDNVITIEPPTRQDYARGFALIHEALKLPPMTPEKLCSGIEEAIKSRSGARFLEGYLTRMLIQNPALAPSRPDPGPLQERQIELSSEDWSRERVGLREQIRRSIRKWHGLSMTLHERAQEKTIERYPTGDTFEDALAAFHQAIPEAVAGFAAYLRAGTVTEAGDATTLFEAAIEGITARINPLVSRHKRRLINDKLLAVMSDVWVDLLDIKTRRHYLQKTCVRNE